MESPRSQWTGCCAVTLDTARRKSPCARHLRLVQDSKQVAVLDADDGVGVSSIYRVVQATVSHASLFRWNIEMISRFRSAKEQKIILEKAAAKERSTS